MIFWWSFFMLPWSPWKTMESHNYPVEWPMKPDEGSQMWEWVSLGTKGSDRIYRIWIFEYEKIIKDPFGGADHFGPYSESSSVSVWKSLGGCALLEVRDTHIHQQKKLVTPIHKKEDRPRLDFLCIMLIMFQWNHKPHCLKKGTHQNTFNNS